MYDSLEALPDQHEREVHDRSVRRLRALWRVLIQHKFVWFSLTAVLGVAITVVIKFLPVEYTASTSLMIEGERKLMDAAEALLANTGRDLDRIKGEIEVIRSDGVVGRVQDALDAEAIRAGLELDDTGVDLPSILRRTIDGVASAMQPLLRSSSSSPASMTPEEHERVRLMKALREALEIEQVGKTAVVTIAFSAPDPNFAAEAANLFADAYMAAYNDRRARMSEGIYRWLERRAQMIEDDIGKIERQIVELRMRHGIYLGIEADTLTQRTTEVTDSALASTAAAKRLAAELEAASKLAGRGGFYELALSLDDVAARELAIEEAKLAGEIADARSTFGPRHPALVALAEEMSELRQKISDMGRAYLDRLERQMAAAEAGVEAFDGEMELLTAQRRRSEEGYLTISALERQAVAKRGTLEAFLQRLSELDDITAAEGGAWIMSPATIPDLPSSPSKTKLAAVGLVGSSGLSAILILLFFDRGKRVHNAQSLAELGLPVIGLLPKVRGESIRSSCAIREMIMSRPPPTFATQLAYLTYSLWRTSDSAKADGLPCGRVVAVVSPSPADGKTSTLAALGCWCATSGLRTLIVECDHYRPKIGHIFERDRFLGNTIDDVLPRTEIDPKTLSTDIDNLYIIFSGEGRLSFHHQDVRNLFGQLIAEARQHFDVILIDTPPLLAVHDAVYVAPVADLALMCCFWDQTRLDDVHTALDILQNCELDVVAAGIAVDALVPPSYGYERYGAYARASASKELTRERLLANERRGNVSRQSGDRRASRHGLHQPDPALQRDLHP